MYDPHTRESRGFGFMTVESAEEAEAAVTALGSSWTCPYPHTGKVLWASEA